MITKEHLVNGLISYIDCEVIPNLSTSGKWVVGTGLMVLTPKAHEVVNVLSKNSLVKAMDVVDDNGMIDSNKLIDGLEKSASKYGSLEMVIPLVGTLRFSASDVSKLRGYMNDYAE